MPNHYPTRRGLLPVLCALYLHHPRRRIQEAAGLVRLECRRCGAYRIGLGDLTTGRAWFVRRWTDP